MLAVRHGNYGNCEMPRGADRCNATFGVGLAHRMKRRKMPSFKKDREAHEAELRVCAYLCASCHLRLEQGDPQVMYDTVTEIVESRD